MEWIVSLDADLPSEFGEEMAERVIEKLADYSPAVGGQGHRIGVTMSVEAADDREASDRAHAALDEALGITPRVVDVRVQTVDELERELEAPDLPALAGISEVAAILGVSRQRASQLAASAAFPHPISALAAGPVWLRSAIVSFGAKWDRQVGRPRSVAKL